LCWTIKRLKTLGEQKAKIMLGLPMTISRCRVSFHDAEGIEHIANVQAGSVYEAVALALREFKEDSFVPTKPTEQTLLNIEVIPDPREHKLRIQQVVKWAGLVSSNPGDKIRKQHIKELLQKSL
jgi:hypothetical protein